MKTLNILFFLILFALTACNGSSNSSAPDSNVATPDPDVATLKTQVRNLTLALAATTHEDAQRFAKLQLVGQAHGVASDERVMAIGQAAAVSPNFGPCTDMGTLIGRGGKDSNIPLASALESFQTCTGYAYTVSALDGTIQGPPYAAWDQPNCQGNLLIITDIPGDGFNPQVVNNGVVFTDPTSGQVLMITAGTAPQSFQIQSAMNLGPGGGVCGSPDIETRMVVTTKPNDVSITGVQSEPIPLPISITAP